MRNSYPILESVYLNEFNNNKELRFIIKVYNNLQLYFDQCMIDLNDIRNQNIPNIGFSFIELFKKRSLLVTYYLLQWLLYRIE